ncbi:RNA polymerase, sigma-24 subunit, ECF subfamily [Kribbella flavida DSM 17836]|uniref:RNA polymerase, sigma-24 subunit, ECF subfamily n=1 Tax=Kribbella flavida (strain DSM 17836 / JCM 10339 / NBRC 14399) TaxID=479435 RepID=D2PU48_KRIFD|nr:SigE family RNA polymerase sigma factor [Kribbella flavida]ADB35099.1 RNA polymerase, sigma-24 subunit, ECF subfamily [Kribbella flavida DSM 17836]
MEAALAPMQTGSGPLDFELFVSERADALLRFAYVLTGDVTLAEDAVQDALTTACARWARVSRADDPEAYVKRMVVNAHISWWRRFRRREAPTAEPTRTAAAAPDGAADRADAEAVWELCKTLPDRQRAAVVLRFYEDLSYAEIGALLHCAEATARSHVHRALAVLKNTLAKEGAEDA